MLKDITSELAAMRDESAMKMLAPNANHNKLLATAFKWELEK